MAKNGRNDKAYLLATAKTVASKLKIHCEGSQMRIRLPSRASGTLTDGWKVAIGDLGKNRPKLELWLDRFSGYDDRKLWACFASYDSRRPILAITQRVSRKLWPVRTITQEDTENKDSCKLTKRLLQEEFNVPLLEKYFKGQTYYGIYDPTRETKERISHHFCTRAVSFFTDVARALPRATTEDEQREVYPQQENRTRVKSHLQRERSRLLASECKIRDNYKCQVCGFRFWIVYGKLGSDFAEAHHLVPLGKLKDNVRTGIEDLTTVCSNCHRMLHKMVGNRNDVERLRSIIRNRR